MNTLTSFFKNLRYGATVHSTRDWLALLTLSVLLLVGIVIWNIWAFDRVANGGVIGAAATSTPPIFNQASLDSIHTIFINRAEEEMEYQTGAYRFADPSQ